MIKEEQMYYQPETNRLFTLHAQIRASLPHVMFGESITDEDLASQGIYPLLRESPSVGSGQLAVPAAIDMIDDQWTQLWSVRDMTNDEIEAAKPPIPQQITAGQGREALYNDGLFANVQPAIDAIDDVDTKWRVQNAWDNRPTWERQSPFVAMMAGILGLDGDQTDQLFIAAAQL
jgi:hypothetical protein